MNADDDYFVNEWLWKPFLDFVDGVNAFVISLHLVDVQVQVLVRELTKINEFLLISSQSFLREILCIIATN